MQPSANDNILKKLYPVILVSLVIFASVVLLSFVNAYTAPLIKAQSVETVKVQLKELFPDMTDVKDVNDIFVVSAGGKTLGYAFTASGTGYGGTISILVGLENDTTVKGIRIISQTETKGLGSRITLPSFTDEFTGKNINDIKLKSDGGQIDAITGSSISSKAVINAVRETALAKVQALPK
jgi:electron transport complex protein RnfG